MMEFRPILSAMMRSKTGPLLVAIQIALSLAILVNALYVVSLRYESASRPSGIVDEQDVLYMQVRPVVRQNYAQLIAQQNRDIDALKAIPGAKSVSWTSQMPMSTSGSTNGFTLNRKQVQPMGLSSYYVPPSFIPTTGLKLIEGRNFADNEVIEFNAEATDALDRFANVAIITRAAAEQLYPGQSPIGKPLFRGGGEDAQEMRIIGVVERLQSTSAQEGKSAEMSVLLPVRTWTSYSRLVVRAEPGQRDRVLAEATTALRKASPIPRVIRARTVSEDRYERYRNERSLAWTLLAVSALLLLVTASGIVGMTMLRVAQRRKQIGVRRAIGARRSHIVRYFVVENFMITTAGIAAGVLLAIGLNQVLVSQLALPKLPVPYLLYGVGTLWLLGIAAVYGPAWRAAGIPPAIATRSA
jgi:putative ABC transport system permease protein